MQLIHVQPVILAGGSGTRLWPISRGDYPKQLLQLDDELTMLQRTAVRLHSANPGTAELALLAPLVVCGEDLRFLVAQQLNAVDAGSPTVILEPAARNTAPAIAAAAHIAAMDDPNCVLVVMPADHVIADADAFCEAVATAALVCAEKDVVATFGVKPTRAETGFGYIQRGEALSEGVYALATFVEKPDAITAEQLVADGQHYWNAGIFLAKASVLIRAVTELAPEIGNAAEKAVSVAARDGQFLRLGFDEFCASPSDSMDFAVMEKLNEGEADISAVVVPLDAQWSDVGSWEALLDVLERDDAGNVSRGDVVSIDSRNCVHISTSRLVTSLGVRDLVIVETPDAVFVAPKSESQRVKELVTKLNEQQRSEVSSHQKVYRPWGTFESLDTGARYQVKRLTVNPGASLSLQLHYHRAEHWVVVRGTARVTRGDEQFLLSENESTYLPVGTTHRLENPGKVTLEVIEVQSGSYLGEDDIVRLDDVYQRS
jgi:mannose-1-phosphate guanylyltransferase / mannose-6-phosphate isomerase